MDLSKTGPGVGGAEIPTVPIYSFGPVYEAMLRVEDSQSLSCKFFTQQKIIHGHIKKEQVIILKCLEVNRFDIPKPLC